MQTATKQERTDLGLSDADSIVDVRDLTIGELIELAEQKADAQARKAFSLGWYSESYAFFDAAERIGAIIEPTPIDVWDKN